MGFIEPGARGKPCPDLVCMIRRNNGVHLGPVAGADQHRLLHAVKTDQFSEGLGLVLAGGAEADGIDWAGLP